MVGYDRSVSLVVAALPRTIERQSVASGSLLRTIDQPGPVTGFSMQSGFVSDEDRKEQAQSALLKLQGKDRLRIYLIAIGGTGMAPLACLLARLGHEVSGSDLPLYPPMSDLLADAGIAPLVGFDPAHLGPQAIDLVVVGNAVPRSNVEVAAAEQLELPRISMPEAVGHFLLEQPRSLVATGTHGKTTTSAMAAWVLRQCGLDAGYLIGGAPIGLDASFHLGAGDHFVIEGDEYNAAYFDRGPKFLHYRAQTVTLTSVEYDHVDLYPSAAAFRAAFEQLVAEMPPSGLIAACIDTADVRTLVSAAPCAVVGYSALQEGAADDAELLLSDSELLQSVEQLERIVRPSAPPVADEDGTRFVLIHGGERFEVRLQLWGNHNVANAIAVWCAALANGCAPLKVARALSTFRGVQRRLELLGEPNGVVVIDDFAHHPTEVAASLGGLRERFPQRRIVALFEPRSLSAGRAAFAEAYEAGFQPADRVLLAPVFHADRLDDNERLDLDDLCRRLESGGRKATAHEGYDEIVAAALDELVAGDVVVTMSSGAFGGAPRRLLEALTQRR